MKQFFSIFILAVSMLFMFGLTPVHAGSVVPLVNPIGGTEDEPSGQNNIPVIVGEAIQVVLGVLGSLTLVVFVVGSFQWLTSAGKSEKVQQGVKTMLYAAIGLFIIFGAYAILTTVIKTLTT